MSRFKLNNTVSFPEILNIKKYLSSEQTDPIDAQNTATNATNEIRNENALENNEHTNLYDYELFSIMIHSGSATGGHYYAYIKCFETDQWYNFNDEHVTKLDRHDISKAFGTCYSMYSSATAYMLLYRQINPARNEKFIKVNEFNDHIKLSLEKEKKQQIEAEMLKEFMENVCKIKVIVPIPDYGESTSILNDKQQQNYDVQDNKRKDKIINIHKDLTLDKAKLDIIKVSLLLLLLFIIIIYEKYYYCHVFTQAI
jgi:ubiquitin carboxyl-terminal hydrolase 47